MAEGGRGKGGRAVGGICRYRPLYMGEHTGYILVYVAGEQSAFN